jgi:phenylacetic acid degradation operon negative regulatory protein
VSAVDTAPAGTADPVPAHLRDLAGGRPLTARSVLASTLLGTDPPRMPVRRLVRAGALFGLSEGTVRTALSRMAAAGEVTRNDAGRYSLAGPMVERQRRQQLSRAAATVEWSGRWRQAVVDPGARSAAERAGFRRAMERLRLGELRDGVWLRPDNLDPARLVDDRATVDARCRWFSVHPDDDGDLAATLWDLDGWAARATELRRAMAGLVGPLEAGDTAPLASGFVLSAAVLRHFNADPLLPVEVRPRRWPGDALRADYERYDGAYRSVLADWLATGD